MPTYTYMCWECDTKQEAFRKMDDMHECPVCKECESQTRKVPNVCNIGAFSSKVADSYESPIDGKVISSERQRQYDMESNGCRPWEGIKQEKKAVARQEKLNDEKLDKAVDTEMSKQISQMPSAKRKKLGL